MWNLLTQWNLFVREILREQKLMAGDSFLKKEALELSRL